MKCKKIMLGLVMIALCMGLFSGCINLPWDFRSSEEAQAYVLSRLEKKYQKSFVFVEEPTYKEEKIGIHWISGKIAPEDDPQKVARVYARNTAMFEDTYHAYFFADQLRERAAALFDSNDCIRDMEITVKGRGTDTLWTGEEAIEEYLEKGEYEIIADVYLYEDRPDEEYVEQIQLLIEEINGCGLNIQLDVWDKPDEWIYRVFADDVELAKDGDYILESIHSHRSLRESIEDYEQWKKENQENETNPQGN